jgi:heme/copper-type cytochrome/quinol oxidase subunit 2
MKWRLVSGIAIGITALLVAFVPPPSPSHPTDRFFHVDAESFTYSPAVLSVNPGDQVTIELTSTDVVHGLYVDGYNISVIADPGQSVTLTFTADRSGTFRLRCSVTCGALHPFMLGKLKVGTNFLFWRGVGLVFVALLGIILIRKPSFVPEN